MATLVTGKGTSGSWQVRGVQLGAAIGATVQPNAHRMDYENIILVKRPTSELLQRMRGRRVIWDVIDSYPQPMANYWSRSQCVEWLKLQVHLIQPFGIIAATSAMADDLREFFRGPVLWLPHHHRPGLKNSVPRETILKVGYEGGVAYLGKWKTQLENICDRMGWMFVVNPPSISDLDIVVALRDASGYAPRAWKSNIKLSNAQASGVPIICNRESGYLETSGPGVKWADTPEELEDSFEELLSYSERCKPLGHAPTLEECAQTLKQWLSRF